MSSRVGSEDIDRLDKLLWRIRDELDFVVKNYNEIAPDRFRSMGVVTDTWEQTRKAIDRAAKILTRIPNAYDALQDLQDHGLVDGPLESKVKFLEISSHLLHDLFARIPRPSLEVLRRNLAWFSRALLNLLESFASLLGPLGAVVEFVRQLASVLEYPEVFE